MRPTFETHFLWPELKYMFKWVGQRHEIPMILTCIEWFELKGAGIRKKKWGFISKDLSPSCVTELIKGLLCVCTQTCIQYSYLKCMNVCILQNVNECHAFSNLLKQPVNMNIQHYEWLSLSEAIFMFCHTHNVQERGLDPGRSHLRWNPRKNCLGRFMAKVLHF